MAKETATAEWLRARGYTVLSEEKDVTLTTRLMGVLTTMREHTEMPDATDFNKRSRKRYFGNEDDSWMGGSFQDLQDDLAGKIDMRPFEKARGKFAKSDLAKRLREKFEKCQPRRQRVKSEYDGEFNESRRWDITPFDGIQKAPGYGRAIDVVVYGSVNGGTSAAQLDSYGCLVWALVDIIESAGVNARVLMRYRSSGTLENGMNVCIDVETKKAGEYVAPSLLATPFKSNFFRRAIFCQYSLAGDAIGVSVRDGLGSAYNCPRQIEFRDGQLLVSPEVSRANTQEIENELLKAIA